MAASFFFYDLETSGFDTSAARIMQFAGQRTDTDLKPVGDPVNLYIKMAADILPDPDAVLVTGITPQQTLADGLTEAEFLRYFYDEVVQPGTTFLGFNSVRFDDEFMRYLHWRNFYDPYEWQWANDCSRWDVLDLVRMTRALRPEGIQWPFTPEGKPTNRLELLTKLNGLEHEHAHDALSDVHATIAVTKLIRDKQPELFKYLFEYRNKKQVADLLNKQMPFVYTSGRYPSETLHTTAATWLAKHPQEGATLVYDLRHDPSAYASMSVKQLVEAWRYNPDRAAPRFPVKTLKHNRCPAIAPLGVMNKPEVEKRLRLPLATIKSNFAKLKQLQAEFGPKVLEALAVLDAEREAAIKASPKTSVDARLYENFISNSDKNAMAAVRQAKPAELSAMTAKLSDNRLKELLPLYKARNYPRSLSAEERAAWDAHVAEALFEGDAASRLARYFERLSELAKQPGLSDNHKFLLEELQLYGQSIVPSDATA